MRILLFTAYLFICTFNLNAQQPQVRELKPFVNLEKGLYNECIDSLDQFISYESGSYYLIARINAYIKLGEYDKALEDCKTLEKTKNGSTTLLKAEIFLLQNEIKKAELAILDNLKSSYKVSLFQLLTDSKYRKIQDSQFIDSILKTNVYSSTEKQIYKIEKYINSGNLNEAMFLANEVISRNSNIAVAYYLLSKINLSNSELKSAKTNIDNAIYISASNIDFYMQRIDINNKLANYPEVMSDVNKALRLDPFKTVLYLLKAEALLNNSDFDNAINQADFYLELYPQNEEALYVKASSYFQKGEYLDALKYINESLENAKSIKQFELGGDIYMKTSTFYFAEMDYSMALDLDARQGELWAKKGFARYQSGNKAGACADWEKGKRYGSIKAIEYLEKYCK